MQWTPKLKTIHIWGKHHLINPPKCTENLDELPLLFMLKLSKVNLYLSLAILGSISTTLMTSFSIFSFLIFSGIVGIEHCLQMG